MPLPAIGSLQLHLDHVVEVFPGLVEHVAMLIFRVAVQHRLVEHRFMPHRVKDSIEEPQKALAFRRIDIKADRKGDWHLNSSSRVTISAGHSFRMAEESGSHLDPTIRYRCARANYLAGH